MILRCNPAKVSGAMVLRSDLTYTILDMAHYGQWKDWVQKFHQKINDIEMYKSDSSLRAGNPPVKDGKVNFDKPAVEKISKRECY